MVRNRNRIRTNNIRTIKRAFPRFFSLMVMSMLGVFAFAGLMATAPDMITTIDTYLDSVQGYDIRVISDMGLTEDDREAIQNLDGIEIAESGKNLDAIITAKDSEATVRFHSLPTDINKIKLLRGRLPEKYTEAVVEQNFLEGMELEIGDSFSIDSENLKATRVTIVGTVDSPLYYNTVSVTGGRGDTSIGSGTIHYYAYLMDDIFDMDYDTVIYARVLGASGEVTSENGYVEKIDSALSSVKAIRNDRENARLKQLQDDANKEIDEKEAEIKEELDDAWAELEDARIELEDKGQELADAKETLDKAADELYNAKSALDKGKKELDSYAIQLEAAKVALDAAEGPIEQIKQQLEMLAGTVFLPMEQELFLRSQVQAFEQKKAEYVASEAEYQKQLSLYKKKYSEYRSALSKYYKGLEEYNEGKDLYDENWEKYQDGLAEYEDKKAEAEEEIADARKEVEDIKKPEWFLYDRTDYSTYSDYIDDSESIRNLAAIFPIVFFAVAVLISLISMNRMVEDDRLEIGTMKSLGFSNRHIMGKYLNFSLWATIVGGLIGAVAGLVIIPELIFNIYRLLFTLPALELTIQPAYTVTGLLITIVCICGTSVLTAYRVLREKPSELMRPKAPKNGRRIILERIGFIWNRLSFSSKVTIRNLLRYKKRVIVTICGIAGCTALMLTGYGISDSIQDIPEAQFVNVFKFDATAYMNEIDDSVFEKEPEITAALKAQQSSATVDGLNCYLFVVEDGETVPQIADLKEHGTGNPLSLQKGGTVVTEKFASLLDIKKGDSIKVVDVDNNTFEIEVTGICTNYVQHYVYMTKDTYESLGFEFNPKLVYLRTTELNEDQETDLTERLLASEDVLNVTFKNSLVKNIENMLKSLNSVVYILLVLGAILSFVVLYNLANINVHERKREIATLKVLGFYDREVDHYITSETIFMTIVGIILGLVLGTFISHIVVSNVEVGYCRFINSVKPMSYLYAAAFSAFFTLVVNIITHFILKHINMIDSLKSVE